MVLRGRDFFTPTEHPCDPQRKAKGPKVAKCSDCLEDANPSWGDAGLVYCERCVPPELAKPSTKEETHD